MPYSTIRRICRAVGSCGIMANNRRITVHIGRRESHKHRDGHKTSKQSDDYHDGHIKHADRTAKFTRIFQTGEFGCLYCKYNKVPWYPTAIFACFVKAVSSLCLVKHSRAPPNTFVQI